MPVGDRGRQQRSIATREALVLAAGRVFARMTYAEARLKDISEDAQVSPGSMYFHFGNKKDFALAVLDHEQERMKQVLTEVTGSDDRGLDKLLRLGGGLGELISSDVVVQGGIKLSSQPGTDFGSHSSAPYFQWIEITRTIIDAGIRDGSINPEIDSQVYAVIFNEMFVGAQVIAELADSWQSLPARIQDLKPVLEKLLSSPRTGSASSIPGRSAT
ncbi:MULTISPECIES: TetR/AcrR family transcriptional regulator [unclassified Microbacterium]|uniref:TetR/AcrR family transcriptional regulator n=1 Tax=unclassified Microbacterium TaxID=2609290 RepID=UPI000EAA5C5A|nr:MULTISPECIES: TetR/AcrR family transcriptional regulator [unclassified Microbacterium]RKN69287.1 TetR/AcrR family transcriptional regulator [Microbacterium sp. CGR2]